MLPAIAEARSIAAAFVEARQNACALVTYPGTEPTTLADAIAIQNSAIALSDDAIAGWKVGRINSPWLERLGANRLSGPIFASHIQKPLADTVPTGHIFSGGFGAAEAEFVFRLGQVPEPAKTNFSLPEAAALVDAVFIGIEIASSPFSGINAAGPLVTISDFGNNGGLILGAEILDWRNADLENWSIEARINGEPVGQGLASAFPDGPLGSVRFLLENLIARGMPLTPGLLISTGAVTGVHEINDGQHFEARFGDFGSIECKIAYATA